MAAQNLNCAPEFRQNGGFPSPTFVLLEENFPTRRKCYKVPEFRGGRAIPPAPPAMTPLTWGHILETFLKHFPKIFLSQTI